MTLVLAWQYWRKVFAVSLVAMLIGSLFGSGCDGVWVSVLLLAALSLLGPSAMLLVGSLQIPWIKAVSKLSFIVFMLFGGIVVVTGIAGLINDGNFTSNACAGTNAAANFTLNLLRGIGSIK